MTASDGLSSTLGARRFTTVSLVVRFCYRLRSIARGPL